MIKNEANVDLTPLGRGFGHISTSPGHRFSNLFMRIATERFYINMKPTEPIKLIGDTNWCSWVGRSVWKRSKIGSDPRL